MSENQRPPGLYLKPPHGELSFTGAKTALAKAREFGFKGQAFTLCSGPFAYGEMVLGEPEAVGVEDFDARFGEHRVSVKEREKWWPGEGTLYLYAYKEWRKFEKPAPIKVPPMVQTLMGPVEFIQEAEMGQGIVNINISNATPAEVPENLKLLKAMAGDGAAIAELEGEGEKMADEEVLAMGFKPYPNEHAARVRNPGDFQEGSFRSKSLKSGVRIIIGRLKGETTTTTQSYRFAADKFTAAEAKAWLKEHDVKYTAFEAATGEEKAMKDMRAKQAQDELSLTDINQLIYTALSPEPQRESWPGDVEVYDDYVTYQMDGIYYKRAYAVVDGKLQLGEPVKGELVFHPSGEMKVQRGPGTELLPEADKAKSEREQAKEAQEARAKKHGISVKDGGNVTKPGEWADVPDGEWLDPVNYRYPCPDAKQTRAAAAYWGKPKNRAQYSEAEQGKMDSRLAAFKKKFDIAQEEKSAMGSLREQADKALAAMAGLWKDITGGGAEEMALDGETGFKAFKAADGKAYVLTWTTNAFQDRDKEIFTTAAVEEYAGRAWKEITETGSKGQYDFWHAPGSEFANITWAGAVDRFLVELGTFNGDEIGQAFQKFFTECQEAQKEIAPEGWKASHRYKFRPTDRADGVYEWFDKDRTSVLAAGRAANPYTSMEVIAMLTDEQKEQLKKVGDATGVSNLVELIEKRGESETKRLEEAGVAFKQADVTPPAVAAVTATVAPAVEPAKVPEGDEQVEAIAKRVAALMGLEELGKMLTGFQGSLEKVTSRLDQVEKGDLQKVEEKEAWRPNVPWFRASKADSTILDDTKDEELKGKMPEVPPAIKAVTERVLGQPAGGSA